MPDDTAPVDPKGTPAGATVKPNEKRVPRSTRISGKDRKTNYMVAVLIFALFLGSALVFRSVAKTGASDLGVSWWGERAATEARLKKILENVLDEEAVAAWLGGRPPTSRLERKDGDPPKAWTVAQKAAESLTSEAARKRLASRWSRELEGKEDALLANVRAHRLAAAGEESIRTGAIERLTTAYRTALDLVFPQWLGTELSPSEVRTLLVENELIPGTVATTSAAAKTNTKPAAAKVDPKKATETASATGDVVSAFVSDLHATALDLLKDPEVTSEIRRAIDDDLRLRSAQESIAKGVEQDHAGRWMWSLFAALSLTAAVSAIVGGFPFVRSLNPTYGKTVVVVYVVCVILGGAIGWVLPDAGPAFLADPLTRFSTVYELDLQTPTSILTALAGAAVLALLVTAWSSFLIETTTDQHLDDQLATLRWSFLTASFLLVVGVIELYALLQWPSSFMGEFAAAMIKTGAQSSAVSLGAIGTVLLLLIYLPGARVLEMEARARQEEPGSTPERVAQIKEMLERHGFDKSMTQQIARVAQIFAPLLVAPMASLFGLIE